MPLSDVIKTSLEHIQHIARAETVFGEPVKVGEITLVPVSKVSIGFAAGGGGKDEKSGSGAGSGGGVSVTPVAFISISADGDINVHTLDDGEFDLGKLLAMAPEAVKKVSKFFKKKDSDDKGDGEDAE